MATGQKKVIVRLSNGGIHSGYLLGGGFLVSGSVELMDTSGKVVSLPPSGIKLIAYVKDFNLADATDPERLGRRSYAGRPRGEGLWIRITFKDGDVLEGMASSDSSFVDALLEDQGIFLAPPDVRGNSQRIFVPRSAIAQLEFISVITTAARRKALDKPLQPRQPGLFEDR